MAKQFFSLHSRVNCLGQCRVLCELYPTHRWRIRLRFEPRSGTGKVLSGLGPPDKVCSVTHMMGEYNTTHRQIWFAAFAETPDGRLWIGTDGNLWTVRNGQITRFDSGYNRSFRTFAVDSRAILWVGSDFGLRRIRSGQVLHEAALSPLESLKIWSLLSDQEGRTVWIGTRGSGLYLWESRHLHHYGSSSGFPTDSIYAILEDRFHQMWISGPSGVWSIDREALVAAADARPWPRPATFTSRTPGWSPTMAGPLRSDDVRRMPGMPPMSPRTPPCARPRTPCWTTP